MASVEVAKLRLRCDPQAAGHVRFAVEDALRTEIPDDGRLVLLRRMRISGAGNSAHPAQRQVAMRQAWQAATGGARHGREDGAADANCVWFASRAEAEAVLLSRLLKGKAADDWFWKLALPGWHGQAAHEWLGESLGECLASDDNRRLLVIVEACIGAGETAVLVTALEQIALAMPAQSWARASPVVARPEPAPNAPDAASTGRAPEIATAIPVSAPLAEIVHRLAHHISAPAPARAILRAHVLRQTPALALSPPLLDMVVAATLTAITDRHTAARPQQPDPLPSEFAATSRENRPNPATAPPVQTKAPAAPAPSSEHSPISDANSPRQPDAGLREAPSPPKPDAPPIVPVRSEHAGLWLAIPSLCDMGLREWLSARPAMLADHPGRQLMLAVARHYRIAADDPALAVMGDVDPSRVLPEWTRLWRHGLDRWLRRNARRRLHDLVHRRGRLDWDDERLSVIFPPGAADIRLRRDALDRDPGWTDWLGLSIRYHFRDEVTE